MAVVNKSIRPQAAPALFRLLADSALSRAALGCCGVPLVLIDANAKGCPITHANHAFHAFFGYDEVESVGRSLGALLFRGDEPLAQRLLSEPPRRWELTACGKDGDMRHIEATIAAVRGTDGRLSHWVIAFSDRGEIERLRSEVESLKGLAATTTLGLRAEPGGQPARAAQQVRLESSVAEDLRPKTQTAPVLRP